MAKTVTRLRTTAEGETALLPYCNKQIPDETKKVIDGLLSKDEQLESVVITDVDLDGNFSGNFFFITDKRLVSVDQTRQTVIYPLSGIGKLSVKRMYGNVLIGICREGEIEYFNRGTFALSDSFDAVALYINSLCNPEKNKEDLLKQLGDTLKKHLIYCPKCGARLVSEGATCLKCADKKAVYKRILTYVKPQLSLLIISLVLAVITTAVALVPPLLTKELVDNTLTGVEASTQASKLSSLFGIVGLLFAINVFAAIVGAFRSYFLNKASERTVRDIKSDLYRKAQYLSVRYYDKISTGQVISYINTDTMTLDNLIVNVSQNMLTQLLQLIGIIIIMFTMNPVLAFLSLLPIPIVVICSKKFSKYMYPFYARIWSRCAKLNSILADTLPGIRIVKAFTSEKKTIKSFDGSLNDIVDENMRMIKTSSVYNAVSAVVLLIGNIMIWGLGGWMVITGKTVLGGAVLTAGALVAFISYMSMFYGPVQFFVSLNETFMRSLNAAERIFEMLDAEDEEDLGKGVIPQNPVKGSIEFKNVSFSYENGKKTLDNINFTINAGEVVGIVGTTGSGKSTIVNLILRYYSEYEGEILLDGEDVRGIDMAFYRSKIGYVLQEPLLFHDTIYNNIVYNSSTATTLDVLDAASTANAHNFITRLPDSYDTVLGERGTGLSGGEKQRLSIARAVLKDPAILILDEATSAVDSETEELIQQAIERVIKGRTTIMIAHRLSTLKKADKIIVVENGKITEAGAPAELLAKNGRYARLVRIQGLAKGLVDEGSVFE